MHVTLVKEDDKPEDGEELVQRDARVHQGGARTRTTRASIRM